MRNGNNTVVIPSAEYAGARDIVTVSFDLAVGRLSGKNVHFYFYDSSDTKLAGFSFKVFDSSITENDFGINMDDFYRGANESDHSKATRITIAFNYETGKITTTTSCSDATNKSSNYVNDMSFTNPIAKFVVGADYNTNDGTKGRRCQIDNILIQTTEGDYSTSKTITLAFKDNEDNDISGLYTGGTVFTPETGETFYPSAYYPAVMYDGDYKYTYTSGGDAFTVTTDKLVTLVYTKTARPTYTLNVTANYGGNSTKIVDDLVLQEATNYTYYYPRFIKDGTTLYKYTSSTDPNASASFWTSTLTNISANTSYDLTYEPLDGTCVYYAEGEDIAGATAWAFADYKPYMSNGNSGAITSATTITTLDAGVYSVTARAIGRANDRYVDIFKTSADDENKVLRVTSQNQGGENTANFTLTGSTDIIASGGYAGGASGHACDYIYIMQLPNNVSVTVTAAGFATYVPSYDLDFSATEIEAYKVKVTAKGVATMTKVNNVRAGTPVLLYKNGGKTEDIPVMTGAAALSDNDLVAGTGAAVATTNAGYTNMILNNGTSGVGFYLANGQTVASNRAYLHILTTLVPEASAPMMLVFDGEATGIADVRGKMEDVRSDFFDLQGRKVAQPAKGLYIQNGRKVILK